MILLNCLGSYDSHILEDMEDEKYLLNSFVNGITVAFALDKTITDIQIFSGKDDEFKQYRKSIPFDLSFDITRNTVHKIMGIPQKSGKETTVPILGILPAWDLYQKNHVELYIDYTHTQDSLFSITIRLDQYDNQFDQDLLGCVT